jgi:hypothetical protein
MQAAAVLLKCSWEQLARLTRSVLAVNAVCFTRRQFETTPCIVRTMLVFACFWLCKGVMHVR